MDKYGIGQSLSRFEDPRLLRGAGRFVNDVSLPRQAYATFLRSPHAHAAIRAVDTTAAKAAPGVLGVFTEADVAAEKLGTTRLALPRKRADGSPAFARPHPGLARGSVRYVGDPVAMVVAETLAER
jgi:aerobic carbon-monoxide dehydrogenase large subunit